jgi:putative ABC transport system permease protein
VRWESAVIAVLGTLTGLAVGLLMGWALITAAARRDIVIGVAVPIGQLIVVAVVGGFAGALAAWRPARRAARLDVIDALASG